MEPVDGNRQSSGISSIIHREQIERINTERPYTSSVNTMAAAAVASPLYPSNPPPPYSTGWSGPAHALSGLISPLQSRRSSDNEKSDRPAPIQTSQTHRQSLPSIHEALGTTPKSNPYVSPVSASLPPAAHQLPYAQPQQAPPLPRTYPPSDHSSYSTHLGPSQQRPPSPPQPIHPQSNPFSRPETGPGNFPEAPRHPSITSLQSAPAPHNPYAAPVYDPARYDHDPRAREGVPNSYPHPPPPQPQPPQPPYTYGPAQPPLTPTHQMSMYSQPRYGPRDPREGNDPWKYSKETEKTDPAASTRAGLKRNLDVWDFENNLAEINISSSALQEWSAHYNAIAQEQQRSQNTLPDRMPTMESVDDMMRHQLKISSALQRMQSIILEQASIDQRMREQGNRLAGEYEDDMSLYGDDMKNHGYTSEGKKRRGRAAPPGRCHSCNRAETPEWRRGPDGARTLCNACGLHYAKLTRKNTMKQSQGSNGSSLRPKSMDGVSPR